MRPVSSCLPLALGLIALGGGSPVEPQPPKLVLQAPPAASVNSVAVSPDGSLVATAAGEGGVRLYDAKTGALIRTIGEAGDRSVTFSPAISAAFTNACSASGALFACTVHTNPHPALTARVSSKASAPRTSPTTMRSGRIARTNFTS